MEPVNGFMKSSESLKLRMTSTVPLLWGLTEGDWGRAAEHPYRGSVTLEEVARELAQHDLEHLWQVRQLKEKLREAVSARDDD